jgi:hypothetical protein
VIPAKYVISAAALRMIISDGYALIDFWGFRVRVSIEMFVRGTEQDRPKKSRDFDVMEAWLFAIDTKS